MWMGIAWNGMYPSETWTDYGIPLAEQPCLPPLSEEELTEWTALVKHL